MGAITVQILIEETHSDYKGIKPTHYLFLSEEGISSLTLVSENLYTNEATFTKKVWNPTLENTLEDAFLMIALYVLKDEEITNYARDWFKDSSKNNISMYNDIDKENRLKLYELSRNIYSSLKIVVTIMDGSSILNQLKIIEDYQMEIEVCTTSYSKLYYSWAREKIEKGKL